MMDIAVKQVSPNCAQASPAQVLAALEEQHELIVRRFQQASEDFIGHIL